MAVTVRDLAAWKASGTRFVMLTAYDYPTARLLAEAEVPVLLVGDTLADNVLGYANTIPVTMPEMLHHARAVARGAPEQLLIGDLPFGAYQRSCDDAILNATDYLKAGMHAIKLEGGGWVVETVARLTQRGIPVMGHLGLTPQSVNAFGGHEGAGTQRRRPGAAARRCPRAAGRRRVRASCSRESHVISRPRSPAS